MSLIKRFIAWIIRIIAFGVALLGLIMLIVGLVEGPSDYVTPGAIMLVVGVVVGSIAAKTGRKVKAKSVNKCKKCGSTFYGADCKYKCYFSKASKAPISGLWKVPVDLTLICPNCGKEKTLYEYIEIADCTEANAEEAIQSIIDEYCNA